MEHLVNYKSCPKKTREQSVVADGPLVLTECSANPWTLMKTKYPTDLVGRMIYHQ